MPHLLQLEEGTLSCKGKALQAFEVGHDGAMTQMRIGVLVMELYN